MRRLVSDSALVKSFCDSSSYPERHVLFEELIGRYSRKMHNLALRITRSEDETEDVLQEVFTTVFVKLNTFRGDSAFSSWLYRITANTCFLALRSRKRNSLAVPEEIDGSHLESQRLFGSTAGEPYGLEDNLTRLELRKALQQAIGTLPRDHRTIFVLRDVDGLSNAEIGKVLRMTVPAVKSRLHRSRLVLRKRLQRHYDDYSKPQVIMYGKGYYESERYKAAA